MDPNDSSGNGKITLGLDWQNNNFARASCFLDIFLPMLHDHNVKLPKGLTIWLLREGMGDFKKIYPAD